MASTQMVNAKVVIIYSIGTDAEDDELVSVLGPFYDPFLANEHGKKIIERQPAGSTFTYGIYDLEAP
jgi:hypothetical protein